MIQDLTFPIAPPRFDVTQDIVLQLPAVVNDTSLRVLVSARDEAGVESAQSLITVRVSGQLPIVTVTAPSTGVAGGTIDMTVRAVSPSGVASIRIEMRGATTRDTTIVINPPRTDITQFVTLRIPADVVNSQLTVRVFAIDARGTPGPVQTTLVTVAVDPPVILSLTPTSASARGGQRFDVRVIARGSRPLTRIDLRFRGAVDADQVITVTPNRNDVTADAFVDIPLVVRDTQMTVFATATDAAGAVSAIASFRVTVADVTDPTVTVTATPATAPSGSTVSIRVVASDNVGLATIGYEVHNAAGTLIGTASVTATGTSQTSTLSFTIPGGTPAGPLTVTGFATDGSGRRGNGTTTLTVT
jgi:hypothetical protein